MKTSLATLLLATLLTSCGLSLVPTGPSDPNLAGTYEGTLKTTSLRHTADGAATLKLNDLNASNGYTGILKTSTGSLAVSCEEFGTFKLECLTYSDNLLGTFAIAGGLNGTRFSGKVYNDTSIGSYETGTFSLQKQ